ncbi:MAG: phosphate acyltransferase PlsX [Oscillospiraceae bacterium]|nr:phosphate acyltransferase PlsX [Oscillospiraceae bacterium]
MKIIVDAMGGDFAPKAAVEGAFLAMREFGVETVLVGDKREIETCIKQIDPAGNKADKGHLLYDIVHTTQAVTMEDDPARVIREKKDSSLVVGLTLLRDGFGDAFVSAGNTGALLSGATLITKRIRGIRRAALSPVIPNKEGGALLVDCGANAECTPEYLMQFAFMGSYYVNRMLNIEKPRIGLLNNGTEAGKGTQLQRDTYELLQAAHEAGKLNFIGNVEARSVLLGGVDVVVTDGFTGNVLLKGIEGTAMFLMGELKPIFKRSAKTKVAALLVRSGLMGLKAKLDVSEHGGTALLGITKPVIKAHGNSDAKTMRSAIRQARELAQSGIIEDITANIDAIKLKQTDGE